MLPLINRHFAILKPSHAPATFIQMLNARPVGLFVVHIKEEEPTSAVGSSFRLLSCALAKKPSGGLAKTMEINWCYRG